MFSDACPDIRWVGNEEGWAMKTNWAPIRRDEFYPGSPNYKELRTGHEDGTHWVPAEVDVSIRPGWFYHAAEDHQVKSLPQRNLPLKCGAHLQHGRTKTDRFQWLSCTGKDFHHW